MIFVRTVLAWLTAGAGLLLALPIVFMALPFWLVGGATRLIARALAGRAVGWEALIRYDARLGWAPKPNLRVRALDQVGNPFRVTTDEDGWRGRRDVDSADVVVFGDSFAFGNAIDDRRFFAEVLRRPRVKSIGAPGYNLVQSFQLMSGMGPRLRGKLVVWLIYLGNDLEDTLRPSMGGYRAPFLRPTQGGWKIEDRHLIESAFPIESRGTNYESFVDLCRPGSYLGERARSACEHLIVRAKKVCDAAEAPLAILSVPDLSNLVQAQIQGVLTRSEIVDFDADAPDRMLAEVCARHAVRFVPLRQHLEPGHYLTRDVHWNAAGHREVAGLLRRLWSEAVDDDASAGSMEGVWRRRSFAGDATSAAVGDR